MWTGLWDLERALLVAFVSGEGQGQVELLLGRYGSARTVEAVVMDLSEPYRQAVLPQAAVVADKFHLLALAARALGEVCREGRRPRACAGSSSGEGRGSGPPRGGGLPLPSSPTAGSPGPGA
jgi:transposase